MKQRVSRRQFLSAGAIAGAGIVLGDVLAPRAFAAARTPALPPTGANAPFDHVVVCMMENRSFDHFLGWLPGADGKQAGLTFTDNHGTTFPTYNLAPDFEGCGYADPNHAWDGGLIQMNGGKMDGFLKTAAPGDTFPIGYYTKETVNVLGTLVQEFGTSDNYFCSILAATYPNRFYQHSAQTDRDSTTPTPQSTLPAIWDQLSPLAPSATTAVTGRYYSTDLPFTALWVNKYAQWTHTFPDFLADCAAGTLPNVAFVDPEFVGEGQGFSRDDHPHADVRSGEYFLMQVYNAVRQSPQWNRTVLIINYDEWGGFYDHVVPPHVIDDKPLASNPKLDTTQLGFRVPLAVVSPLVPKGTLITGGAPFEHTSALRMIEWRFGLTPLCARDANARNLAEFLDLSNPARTDTVTVPVPATAVSTLCGPTNSTPFPPGAVVPEFGWTPGLTIGGAAVAAGWMAKEMRTRRTARRTFEELQAAEAEPRALDVDAAAARGDGLVEQEPVGAERNA
jgi:phospholipase C